MPAQPKASHNSTARSSGKVGRNSTLDVRTRHALGAWARAKQNLERVMQPEDFRSFVRPMRLCAVFSQTFLLIALPPNRRIVERARNFKFNLAEAIALEGYRFAGFTAYPTDDQLLRTRDFPSFAAFCGIIEARRMAKTESARVIENRRDSADLRQALGAV